MDVSENKSAVRGGNTRDRSNRVIHRSGGEVVRDSFPDERRDPVGAKACLLENVCKVCTFEIDRNIGHVVTGTLRVAFEATEFGSLSRREIKLEDARSSDLRYAVSPTVEPRTQDHDLRHTHQEALCQRIVDYLGAKDRGGPRPRPLPINDVRDRAPPGGETSQCRCNLQGPR